MKALVSEFVYNIRNVTVYC